MTYEDTVFGLIVCSDLWSMMGVICAFSRHVETPSASARSKTCLFICSFDYRVVSAPAVCTDATQENIIFITYYL